jgi:hypothetical protein
MMEAPPQKAQLPLPVQPVQEPVARVMGTYGGRFVCEPINPTMVLTVGMALYAAPLPVQRQPLTDEQIKQALISVDHETKRLPPGMKAFARAVEAAHNIGAKP